MLSKQQKAIAVSWCLWFVGIFATTILATVKANLDAGVIPPITVADVVTALWSAVGAAVAVAIQYLDKKYTRYGINASNANATAEGADTTEA